MPHSSPLFDGFIVQWVQANIPPTANILDVGAGAGKYGKLLRHSHPNLDALEIWEPNLKKFNLLSIYRRVLLGDIRTFDTHEYQFLIFGDVLEHLTVEDAQAVLNTVRCDLLVKVPYTFKQGSIGGNTAEIHHQPDLSLSVMNSRYPSLTLISPPHPKFGVFCRRKADVA